MSPQEIRFRQRAVSLGMLSLIVVPYLAGRYISPKANVVGLCLWGALFLSNGLLATVRPIGWLRLMGNPVHKPLSLTANAIIRCCGVFVFLVGAMMGINLAVNFSGYWNGLY